MPPKSFYKYKSGAMKLKKKKAENELIKSQAGAIFSYFSKQSTTSNVDANVDGDGVNLDGDVDVDVNLDGDVDVDVNLDGDNVEANVDVNIDEDDGANMDEDDDVNLDGDNVEANTGPNIDIFDPRMWDGLNPNMTNVLVEKGPNRDLTIKKGPRDKFGRRFSSTMYTRTLENKASCDRDWLVYSKELDKIFCFCCKLFKDGISEGCLDDEGYADWKNASARLKEHEVSLEHMKNMKQWYEMRKRLNVDATIDQVAYAQYKKEKEYWKQVIFRIISLIKYLAKHGIAFRGTKEKLNEKSNGNFMGLVETFGEYDPIIKEHIRRVKHDDLRVHYLGHNIQNELILLLADEVRLEIIKNIKQAKYYSIILDCTPDVSHQEQMTLIVRYVNVNSNPIKVEESFLGFLIVNDTTGKGLFDVTLEELERLGLDVDDMRGQGYDNGSNMKGKHQGVQSRFSKINPRAFYTPCGCHSLNLTLCDMANTCTKCKTFFGIIQRIYTIFANSTKRWQILKDNVKGLTLKSLSTTRWESRVESVKAIRFQVADIREALLQVGENDDDPLIQSAADSLANTELGDFSFLVSIVIWYEILAKVNIVSKKLQSKDMILDVAIKEVNKLIIFFKEFRETGLANSIKEAKEIAIKIGVDPLFPQRRQIRRKKQFDESSSEPEVILSAEENFKVNYFLVLVDQAIVSLEARFEQYKEYEKIFGFLFPKMLRELEETKLKSRCYFLQDALKYGENSDIDADELFLELKLFETFLPRHITSPFDALAHLQHDNFFPNALIAYRIMLTVPVTVASAERSFSKLKLLKSYLRSTMTQERLNGLAILSIEDDILENVDYEVLVEKFATKNAKRASRFV
ncbi:hypothetical protein SSX86_005118 [Deinandra increscens subsp. villosa]|uniref:TTF-type domain-containing protein n=1 Tax=Deinandra increscens subsp. villosa TaxID=3103831 RepID=A0AAP0H871_9ASTR